MHKCSKGTREINARGRLSIPQCRVVIVVIMQPGTYERFGIYSVLREWKEKKRKDCNFAAILFTVDIEKSVITKTTKGYR